MNQPQERNWCNRNWKWFVPVGCLVLLVGFCAGIAYLGFGLVKSFETYKEAVAKAKTNSAVMEALGSPVKKGLLVAGNINVSGPSGQADLAMTLPCCQVQDHGVST